MQPWPTTKPMFGPYSDGRAACKANAVLDAPALSHVSSHTPWFLGGFMCAVLVGVVLLQCFPCHVKVQWERWIAKLVSMTHTGEFSALCLPGPAHALSVRLLAEVCSSAVSFRWSCTAGVFVCCQSVGFFCGTVSIGRCARSQCHPFSRCCTAATICTPWCHGVLALWHGESQWCWCNCYQMKHIVCRCVAWL